MGTSLTTQEVVEILATWIVELELRGGIDRAKSLRSHLLKLAAGTECQGIDPSMTCLSFPLYPASKVCTYACSPQKPCNANFECLDQICVVR